jgi:hypothetical protein
MSYRASLMTKFQGRCLYCLAEISHRQATTDHFIPRRHGGANSEANRVLACFPCNNAKGDFNPIELGLWHPDDESLHGREAMLRLRRIIVRRQLSKLKHERENSEQAPGLPVKAELTSAFQHSSTPEETAVMDKILPVYHGFSVDKNPEDRDEQPLYRPIGAVFLAEANNGAPNFVLKRFPLDASIVLLPQRPRDKQKDET